MKKHIITMFILSIYTLSLNAYSNELNESILTYDQIKKDNYIKKLTQKRDSIVNKRDERETLRKYQELRFSRR